MGIEFDVYRRQILTSKVDLRAVRVNDRGIQDMRYPAFCSIFHTDDILSNSISIENNYMMIVKNYFVFKMRHDVAYINATYVTKSLCFLAKQRKNHCWAHTFSANVNKFPSLFFKLL